ncbi:aminoglycoside phosphotransferase family protein [Actinopolymorpha pittospori]
MDAEQLVAELNARTGANLLVVGRAALGEVSGAVYVRWPDGHDGVVTQVAHPYSAIGWLSFIGDVLELARSRGALVPRYELIAELSSCAAIVQERLPGSPPQRVDEAVVDAIVAANEGLTGLLHDRPDVPAPDLYLRESGQNFCLHETLAQYDDRSRKLLDWIREVGRTPPDQLSGSDLVHWDLVPGNVLLDEHGKVTGIVDWDGIGRGDCHFSLIKLRFVLAHWSILQPAGYPEVSSRAVVGLDEHLQSMLEPDTFRLYWAHWSLSMVDWTIRHHSRAEADLYLDLATSRLQ